MPQRSLSGFALTGPTPISPNFTVPGLSNVIPPETLVKWAEIVAMMFSSTNSETSAALTAMGDQLLINQWTEAAHAWSVNFIEYFLI